MPALGWLMNLDFAASGAGAPPEPELSQRVIAFYRVPWARAMVVALVWGQALVERR